MHTIDWLIIWGFLIGLVVIAGFTLRYTRRVADFLAANRCAGRYLLTNTNGMVVLGAATVVSLFQVGYENGFTGMWWGNILTPITSIVTLSGWIEEATSSIVVRYIRHVLCHGAKSSLPLTVGNREGLLPVYVHAYGWYGSVLWGKPVT